MPWSPKDAAKHSKKAKSKTARKQWSEVANSVLKSGAGDARAIRTANGVIKKRRKK